MRGFTLLEMMVVVTIISLLSLGAWSGWHGWQQRLQLDDSAQQIQRLLQRLRSDANWHNTVHLVWLKSAGRWCLGTGTADCLSITKHALRAPHPGVIVELVTRDLGFYGRKNNAHPGAILIGNEAGKRRIIVSSHGRVRVCSPSEENCR